MDWPPAPPGPKLKRDRWHQTGLARILLFIAQLKRASWNHISTLERGECILECVFTFLLYFAKNRIKKRHHFNNKFEHRNRKRAPLQNQILT